MRQRGFTLIEVLVAFAILSLSLGVMMQLFSTGLRNVALAEQYSRATALAESQLASVGVEEPLSAGQQSGEFPDGYRWQVDVQPYSSPEEQDSGVTELLPVAAYRVDVTVLWSEGSKDRSVTLTTLRLEQAPPSPG